MVPKITIDNRERHVIARFAPSSAYELAIEPMLVGDFRISSGDGSPDILIERKTLSDMASSITDGRFAEQKLRMAASGCKCMYIIEHGKYHGRISMDALRHAMISTMMRDNFFVYYSNGIDSTIDALIYILQKKQEWALTTPDYTGVIRTEKKANMTPAVCFNAQLQQIPGVSTKIASAVSDKWSSMSDMIRSLDHLPVYLRRKELEDIVVESSVSKRIGKVGCRIHDYLWPDVVKLEPPVVKPPIVKLDVKPIVTPPIVKLELPILKLELPIVKLYVKPIVKRFIIPPGMVFSD